MSWVEKELKKRAASAPRPARQTAQPTASAAERIEALWSRMIGTNDALPPELKLRADARPPPAAAGMPPARGWLHAPNGAALGHTAEGIRYVWPKAGKKHSHNFWIRWRPAGYMLQQRNGQSVTGPTFVEHRFDEARVDYLVQCLVVGRLVKLGAVRKKRFWLF